MATTAFSGRWGLVPPETNQSIASGSWQTFIPYDVWVDTDSIDGGSGVLTIPATGIYHIQAWVEAVYPVGSMRMRLFANGTTQIAVGDNPNSTGSDIGIPIVSFSGCLEAGTTIEAQGFLASGTSSSTGGAVTLMRVPVPFSIVEKGTYSPEGDAFEEYVAVCDQPAWLDSGDPTSIVVPDTGYYFLSHKNVGSGGASSNLWRSSELFVNGSQIPVQISDPGHSTNLPMNVVLQLTAGDTVQIFNDIPSGATGLGSIDLMMFKFPGTFVGAQLYKSSQATGAFATVTFNTSVYDTDGFWAGGTSQFLTVPSGKAGTYLVWGASYKAGPRAVYTYLYSSSQTASLSNCVSGVDSYALGNLASGSNFSIVDLAAGDQIDMRILNNDTPGNTLDMNMGVALIDGWTYPRQRGCPCPSLSAFVPQIYRRL